MSVLLAAGLLQAGSCIAADTPQPQPAPVESADGGLTFPQTVSNIPMPQLTKTFPKTWPRSFQTLPRNRFLTGKKPSAFG